MPFRKIIETCKNRKSKGKIRDIELIISIASHLAKLLD